MSEEGCGTMDKKSIRATSAVKTNSNDGKKSDPNKYPRSSKRREPVGSNRQLDNNGKIPNSPKTRPFVDKRPKSRGFAQTRRCDEIAEVLDAELGSEIYPSKKKVSLNHLLNFSFAPRDESHIHHSHGGNWQNRPSHYGGYRKKHKTYNKEQFLQANCQFIVDEEGDYTIHSIDPDKLVDWDKIRQVRVYSHELPSCPICLQDPTAAKITRCGHIYCWPCVLHYLALGDKTWRKCPVCYESIHRKDLKSVVTSKTYEYNVGEEITMVLMKKERGSTYAAPLASWDKPDSKPFNIKDEKHNTRYSKLLTATTDDVERDILTPEFKALQKLMDAAEPSEVCFIEGALAALKEQRELLTKAELSPILYEDKKTSPVEFQYESSSSSSPTEAPSSKSLKKYKSAFSDEEEEEEADDVPVHSPTDTVADAMLDPTDTVTDAMLDCVNFNRSSSEESEAELSFPHVCSAPQLSAVASGDGQLSPSASDDAADTENLGAVALEDLALPSELKRSTTSEFERQMAEAMPAEVAAEHLEMPHEVEKSGYRRNNANVIKDAFYFYQARDGQHIYMHALNAKCLVREYGSLENCPEMITATIVEKENVFITEELRRRLRYLNHLPLTCEFEVAEMTLKPPLLSKETLKFFSNDIEKRRRIRQRKVKDEKQQARMIQDEENRSKGIFPALSVPLDSYRQFPASITAEESASTCSSPSIESGTPVGSPPTNWNINAAEFVPGKTDNDSDGQQTSYMSFAQMLKGGQNKPPPPRSSSKTSDTAAAVEVQSKEDNEEDTDYAPTYQTSFSDAIQEAFEKHEKTKDDQSPAVTGSKKKKKVKMVPLFSTSMARK